MKVVTDAEHISWRDSAVAIGVFDGVHLGHRRLLDAMVCHARSVGAPAVAVTFDPHPLAIVRPGVQPPLVTTVQERLRLLDGLGVDCTCILRFDEDFSHQPAQLFVTDYLCRRLRAQAVFVGFNFRFGSGGKGDPDLLKQLGAGIGIDVHVVPAVKVAGQTVSSTAVRESIAGGQVEAAATMLGRSFELAGTVAKDHGRGRKLGFPTANVTIAHGIVTPGRGVYAVTVCGEFSQGRRLAGVANIGVRPTFGDSPLTLEIHIFDFSGNIYGECVRTAFVSRIRPEQSFSGAAELKAQIETDCERARQLLREPEVYNASNLC